MKTRNTWMSLLLAIVLILGNTVVSSSAITQQSVSVDGKSVKTIVPITLNNQFYFNVSELAKGMNGIATLNPKTGKHFLKIGDSVVQFKENATTVKLNTLDFKLKSPFIVQKKLYYIPASALTELFQIAVVHDASKKTIALKNPGFSAMITSVKGSVEVLAPGKALYAWQAAKTKMLLSDLYKLRTGPKSEVELKFSDGSKMIVGADGLISIAQLAADLKNNTRKVSINLLEGEIWYSVVKQTKGSSFVVNKDGRKLTAYGSVIYSGPSNVSVLSGTLIDEYNGTQVPIPTGTGAIYGSTPVMMAQDNAFWNNQYEWAMTHLEEVQLRSTGSQLGMIQFMNTLPVNDPKLVQLTNNIDKLQETVLWNQFEIRQTAPLAGDFPGTTSLTDFMNKQKELQQFLTSATYINPTLKNNMLKEQQGIMDQFQQNLKVAETQNLIQPTDLTKLETLSIAVESLIPPTIGLDPNFIPQVPLPPNLSLPEISIPKDLKLPPGMVIPPGFDSNFVGLLPQGSMLPPGFKVPEGSTLPEGIVLPPNIDLPDNFKLPEGVFLPPKFDFTGMTLPEGVTLPKGVQLPPGIQLPPGVELPTGFKFTADMKLPTDLTGFTLPPGFTAPTGFIPKTIAGPMNPTNVFNTFKPPMGPVFNPDQIKDMAATGGVVLPPGFQPPEGFMPPMGWKPPTGFDAKAGGLPPGWEVMPEGLSNVDPTLKNAFNAAVTTIFNGNMTLPPGFEIPAGITPPSGFTPPAGWQPPEGWKPPQDFVPPTTWNLPSDWKPEAGFAPPEGFGNIPGKFTEAGWVPPADFAPPEWWTPPTGWTAGQPLPEGSAPWEKLGMPIPGGGMTLPPGFVPPTGMFDPNSMPTFPTTGGLPGGENHEHPPGFIPPTGTVPPGGFVPPTGTVPPGGFVPPTGTVPPAGFVPPTGTVPPAGFVPPTGSTPPADGGSTTPPPPPPPPADGGSTAPPPPSGP